MNDPYVLALFYRVDHDNSVDYSNTKRLCRKEPEFRLEVETEMVRFEFTKHYATENAARKAVEDYIRAWEVDAGLRGGANCFKLKYDRAQIEDRNPTPGVAVVHGSPLRLEVTISEAVPTLSPADYPSPPSRLKITPDVQTLYDRYMGYRRGKEPLTTMAYFCLTVIELSPTKKDFSSGVRRKIRHLSSGKGGQQARKADGRDSDLTDQDIRFLDEAIKAVILRAAQRAHGPDRALPKISMSDLPVPSSESRT